MEKPWKPYGVSYKVSEYGDVYSDHVGRCLSSQVNKDGYSTVSLCEVEGRVTHRIHRLVARAFIPLVEGKEEINHKDGDKSNNHYSNLEWCTHSENIQRAWDNKLISRSEQGTANIIEAARKLMNDNNPRKQKVLCLTTGDVFDSMTLAEEWCGLSSSSISRFLTTPERKTCGKHPLTKQSLTWRIYYD